MNRPNPEPETKPIDIKTTKVVRVEAVTARATSLLPVTAAFKDEYPFSWRSRKMFSSTTTLLSTSIPTAIMRPDKDMMLMVISELKIARCRYIRLKVKTMAMGMAMAIIMVERNFRKKKSKVNTASKPPIMPEIERSRRLLRISSDWSR